MRKLTLEDFNNMTSVTLLSWWLFDQVTVPRCPTGYEMALTAYDTLGRVGVAATLAEKDYLSSEPGVVMVSLLKAKAMLLKMLAEDDRREVLSIQIKRENNKVRKMRWQFGEKVEGGLGKPFLDKTYNLLTVVDLDAQAWRSISLPDLVEFVIGGQRYVVEENKDLIQLIKEG